ncbi:MAG: tRNA (guanosine(46)-N7)-methyltransferase TrmB [bacterium]|nr:tRNA (guanosine(46)-N7)-methyltransferase TrmB [bacterium]
MNSSPAVEPNHDAFPERVVAWDLFRQPLSWPEIVGSKDKLELEIGSGKGLFLQNAASVSPDRFFVGIELSAKFANRAAQRLHRHGITNARMLRGDGKDFLHEVVPDEVLDRLHVYFPDPWWRNKHKKRRVLNRVALHDIQRVLKPGGSFHFWTDVLDYYEHICGEVMDHTQLAGPRYVPERVASHSMDFTTHFERRARNEGQPVYRAIFEKI